MRWKSLINASSEGDRSAEITVHMTEQEAAILTLALENLLQDAFEGDEDVQKFYGFTPAHYVSINFLIEWLEGACSMTREQLRRVNWAETFEELPVEDWAEFAPRSPWPRIQVQELGSVPELPPLLEAELDAIMREIAPAGVFA